MGYPTDADFEEARRNPAPPGYGKEPVNPLATRTGREVMEVKGNHYVITDACREMHGDGEGVVDETLGRLREEMLGVLRGRPVGQGAKLHVRFSVERPPPKTGATS